MSTTYQVSEEKIAEIIENFYQIAFQDPIIGHLFWGVDKKHLIASQKDFAAAMLGKSRRYTGKPLKPAHAHLNIRPAHFGRRQVIMKEVLAESDLPDEVQLKWLDLENGLRAMIVSSGKTPCAPA